MNDRQMKLLAVSQADFVLYDTALFLDTHPNCTQALDYYNNAKAVYERAKYEYETQYGPLSRRSAGSCGTWNWINEPMPWEREA